MKRAWLARIAYIVVIALATIAEPTLPAASPIVSERLGQAFSPDAVTGRDAVDALRNLLLFAGWGAVWTLTAPAGRGWPIVARATGTGLLISAVVEGLQLAAPMRTPSALDVVTNTAGAFAGAFGVAALVLFLRAGRGRRSYFGMPMMLFAVGYGGAVLFEAFSPIFRQERLPGTWGPPFERLGIALQNITPWSLASFPSLDVLLFAPAGAFLVLALAEAGTAYVRAAIITTVAGAAVMAIAEIARGAIGFPIEVGPITAHVLGIALGAFGAARLTPWFTRNLRGGARPLALFWLYALVLMLWSLRPFWLESVALIADKLPVERFIPLMAYRERIDVFSAADVMIPTLQLVPLGALLAVWPLRRHGVAKGLLPAIIVVTALETAQIFIAGRFFDITDLLIAAAALGIGHVSVRRAGYGVYGSSLDALPEQPALPRPG
jgi:VanZ family protein